MDDEIEFPCGMTIRGENATREYLAHAAHFAAQDFTWGCPLHGETCQKTTGQALVRSAAASRSPSAPAR